MPNLIKLVYDIDQKLGDEETEFTVYDKRHQAIHQKCFFTVSEIVSIAAETTTSYAGKTGNKYIHMTPPLINPDNGNVRIRAYENISNIDGGSALAVKNNFRGVENDVLVSWVSMVGGTDVSFDGGTVPNRFYNDYIGGSKNTGQSGRELLEWVLLPNSYYALSIENAGNQANVFGFFLQWYESMNGI